MIFVVMVTCGRAVLHKGVFLLLKYTFQLQNELNKTDDKGNFPLDLALKSGQEELAQNLIEHKCNVNQVAEDGSTLLHKAIARNDEFAAIFLLNNGCDPNTSNWENGDSPLHLASTSKAMEKVAKKLLELGSNPNAQNKQLK